MGLRGPPPKPTALRELEGNPGKRAMPRNEMKPTGAPSGWLAPDHLHGEARREWERLIEPLAACGVLTVVDRSALAAYCTSYARHIKAELMIRRQGEVLTTTNGNTVPNPWLTISRQEREVMKSYLIEFGLTPAARARMGAAMATPPAPTSSGASKSAPPAVGGKFAGLIGKPN